MEKRCTECGETKDLSEFNKGGYSLDGRQNECRMCTRKANKVWNKKNKSKRLKDAYGITLKTYNEMSKAQDHKCAICSKDVKDNKRALAVDHCHATGNVRELLCNKCNIGLGYFNDDTELLNKAIEYLRKHQNDNCCM